MRKFVFALLLACGQPIMPAVAAPSSAPPQPQLVVAISIDQFSAGLFEQNRGRYAAGLKRLTGEGVVFPNGYQSHAMTETCPGHSTLLTGRHPSATGIIGNDWYDAAQKRVVYCVEDASHPVAGRSGVGRGPANLRVSTLGEWLKAAHPASRVVGVSGKDRSAITMTGHNPDAVFWWDDEIGFTTSVPTGTSAAERLAPVATYNAELARRWAKRAPGWTIADRRCVRAPVTRSYGGVGFAQTEAVPPAWAPDIKGKPNWRADAAYKPWFRATPEFDRITLDLAERLIDSMKLGRGAQPDLLTISLGATDYVGHRYGNQGPEMCDQIAHLDRLLGAFLTRLERLRVPVLVVLSADHGSLDATERQGERGFPTSRFSIDGVTAAVGADVKAALGLAADPLIGDGMNVHIAATDPGERQRIETAAIARFRDRPELVDVYRKADILAMAPVPSKPADELSLAERLAESTDRERSGGLLIIPRPFAAFNQVGKLGDAISSHGSPWNYDRRVPILFWWPGARGFEQSLPVETVDIAPTLASRLGIVPPQLDGRCLDLDVTTADSCVAGTH